MRHFQELDEFGVRNVSTSVHDIREQLFNLFQVHARYALQEQDL